MQMHTLYMSTHTCAMHRHTCIHKYIYTNAYINVTNLHKTNRLKFSFKILSKNLMKALKGYYFIKKN